MRDRLHPVPNTRERPKAEAREKAGKAQADPVESCHRVETGKTRDAVARAVGGMSERTYEKAKVVVAAAEARLCGNFPRRGRQVTHRKS